MSIVRDTSTRDNLESSLARDFLFTDQLAFAADAGSSTLVYPGPAWAGNAIAPSPERLAAIAGYEAGFQGKMPTPPHDQGSLLYAAFMGGHGFGFAKYEEAELAKYWNQCEAEDRREAFAERYRWNTVEMDDRAKWSADELDAAVVFGTI